MRLPDHNRVFLLFSSSSSSSSYTSSSCSSSSRRRIMFQFLEATCAIIIYDFTIVVISELNYL